MVDRVVADTDRTAFSILQQLRQCLPALVSDFWDGPVDEVEVEIFQSESFEALIASSESGFVSVVAVPEFGGYERVFAFDAALAEGGADVGFVIVDPCSVDMAIAYLQRVFYCSLGCLSGRQLVYSQAEAWNHDSIVEPGDRFDCDLHMVPENIQGSTSTLIPEKFFEKGVLGKSVHVISAGATFTCVRRGPLSHTGVLQKLYEFIFQILFLSEPDSGLFS